MTKLVKQLSSWRELFSLGQLRFRWLALSLALLFIATIFEGFSFGLLIPFLKQAAGMGTYEGWRNIAVIGPLLQKINFESLSSRVDYLLIVIVLAVIIRQAASYSSQLLYYIAVQLFETRLRMVAYERILSYGCSFFDNVKKGEIHNTLMRFTQEIADLCRHSFTLLQALFFVTIYLIVLVNISLPLSVTAIAMAPLFYFLLRVLFKSIHRFYKKILKQEQSAHGFSFDIFSNIKLVKSMGREKDERDKFNQHERGRCRDSVLAYSLYLLIPPLQEILMTIGIGSIIWIALNYYLKDDSSFLIKLIVSLLLFRRAVGVLNNFFSNVPQVIRRLPYVQEYERLVDPSKKGIVISKGQALQDIKKGIEYREVSMSYAETSNETVLHNISLFIPAGSFTAVVGTSGAGKSTLMELLPRFYDYQKGDILIDGVSLREFDMQSLRASIGFISQDTLVLNDTIYNNIRYAKPNASEEEIKEAAEKARVSDFIKNLPDGIHAFIGDKGVRLSGGELQRLAVARVILRKPKILLLDEATSALDSVSEQLIQESLEEIASNCTTIAIAHRLSTIRHATQVVVLEQGRIVECGKPEDLIAKKEGRFSRYWQAQKFE